VANEEAIGDVRLHLPLLHGLVLLAVAGRVGAALGPHLGGEDETLAVGREEEAAHPAGNVGLLLRLAAPGREEEDPGVPGTGGEEREHRPVGGEGWARVALVGQGQRAGALAVGVDAPEVGLPPDRAQVGRGHREGDAAAVGRDRGLGDALHRVEVRDGEGALLGGARGEGKRREERGGKGEGAVHHGRLRVTESSYPGRVVRRRSSTAPPTVKW
jgi:hypothetical protein